ncbi:hypothetical protein DFJ73DRAFT_776789 [Zopfochytrium polystomum]|nr:hypothetical protein DFJ73DRAFT_776789 [Zopfochytrium polystomum]
MNIIYEHQLRITIQVHTNKTQVMTAPHTVATANYTWNYGPGYCTTWNNEGGTALRNYLSTQPRDPTVTTNFLLTLGHNLNASHAFEEGQGKTGGVMDYSDGRNPIGSGYYGFHPVYNKPEICPYLSQYQGTSCLPLSSTVPASTCGDGVVEGDEDCDPGPGRTSPCCTPACKFVKQCDYMAADAGAAACCQADCTYSVPSTVCGKQSMCRDGACVGVICGSYSNLNACGTGQCTFGCSYDGSTGTCVDGTSFGWGSLVAPTGVHCGTGGVGQCTAGGVFAPTAGATAPSMCGNGVVEAGRGVRPAVCVLHFDVRICDAGDGVRRRAVNGKAENAGCTYGCDFGSGTCYNTASISAFTAASGYAVDGSFCGTGKACRAGTCVAA